MTHAPRKKILRNMARCKECGTLIESMYRHDFKWCACTAIAVDGGKDYIKRSGNLALIEELSAFEDEDTNMAHTGDTQRFTRYQAELIAVTNPPAPSFEGRDPTDIALEFSAQMMEAMGLTQDDIEAAGKIEHKWKAGRWTIETTMRKWTQGKYILTVLKYGHDRPKSWYWDETEAYCVPSAADRQAILGAIRANR